MVICTVVIIIPAWRWYMLPYMVKGWRFGFNIDRILEEFGSLASLERAMEEYEGEKKREKHAERHQRKLDAKGIQVKAGSAEPEGRRTHGPPHHHDYQKHQNPYAVFA